MVVDAICIKPFVWFSNKFNWENIINDATTFETIHWQCVLFTIYNVVIISTDASFDGDGVIAGDDGGCFKMPGFPTVFFNTISMLVRADDTWYRFSIKML